MVLIWRTMVACVFDVSLQVTLYLDCIEASSWIATVKWILVGGGIVTYHQSVSAGILYISEVRYHDCLRTLI